MKDGGPAFPVHPDTGPLLEGMRLRDHFAGVALMGEIAGCPENVPLNPEGTAKWCYEMADAMLAERERGQADAGDP